MKIVGEIRIKFDCVHFSIQFIKILPSFQDLTLAGAVRWAQNLSSPIIIHQSKDSQNKFAPNQKCFQFPPLLIYHVVYVEFSAGFTN